MPYRTHGLSRVRFILNYYFAYNINENQITICFVTECDQHMPFQSCEKFITNNQIVYFCIGKPDFSSSPPGQNGRHCADDMFKCIFMIEKFGISIQIALKFVPKLGEGVKRVSLIYLLYVSTLLQKECLWSVS